MVDPLILGPVWSCFGVLAAAIGGLPTSLLWLLLMLYCHVLVCWLWPLMDCQPHCFGYWLCDELVLAYLYTYHFSFV